MNPPRERSPAPSAASARGGSSVRTRPAHAGGVLGRHMTSCRGSGQADAMEAEGVHLGSPAVPMAVNTPTPPPAPQAPRQSSSSDSGCLPRSSIPPLAVTHPPISGPRYRPGHGSELGPSAQGAMQGSLHCFLTHLLTAFGLGPSGPESDQFLLPPSPGQAPSGPRLAGNAVRCGTVPPTCKGAHRVPQWVAGAMCSAPAAAPQGTAHTRGHPSLAGGSDTGRGVH